ncbi:transcriptional regulator GcvA [Pseudomonas oryzihabitans]|uniref:LysR family transcriptional regulator n=1 Tax=Pseudomonas oryzihabitans TaxID=47885 RepID=A0A2Z5A850_9PSED|nr:transcriptional regulator GcvA [Pseudomonas oryzihabitans]AXA66777.1 LysR family transcriptional regulator [Pseudomonas oryzihabitans]
MKSIVHLNALRAFEASARYQSFSAAASELNVTPAAVGQLVRTLELWLGTALFHRSSSGKVRLIATAAAEAALPDIRAGLERLSLGLERLKENTYGGVLTVTVSPAFAAKWLLPRIEGFHSAWPDIDLRLDTQLRAVDFQAQRIDIGVRYGGGNWPGVIAEKWLDEEVYPVCAPALMTAQAELQQPINLASHTLIHDLSMDSQSGFTTWETWFESVTGKKLAVERGLKINNSAAVLQAAIDGQGIALARGVMAQDDLAAGRLIRLFPDVNFPSPLAYYIVYRPDGSDRPKVKAFRDWMFKCVSRPAV